MVTAGSERDREIKLAAMDILTAAVASGQGFVDVLTGLGVDVGDDADDLDTALGEAIVDNLDPELAVDVLRLVAGVAAGMMLSVATVTRNDPQTVLANVTAWWHV